MKRLFGALFVSAVFFAFVFSFSAPNALAQEGDVPFYNYDPNADPGISTGATGELGDLTAGVAAANSQELGNGNTAAVTSIKPADEAACINFTKIDLGACVSQFVQFLIKNTLLQIAGFLLWLTSNMFSYVIQVGILDFSKWATDALYPLWQVIRQIVSLGVVFIGLYLGFMYILGRDDKFQKYMAWVILFALFVNFSYPAAKLAIDVSNVVSLNVYAATFGNEALNGKADSSAGAILMSRLGLEGLVFSATSAKEGEKGVGDMVKSINSIPAALLVVCFVLYAAYVFTIATFILITRTAALIFLLVVSPFLFIDSILPMFGDAAQKIRKVFFEQLLVGPVFMILLALTTKFLLVFSQGALKVDSLSGEGGTSGTSVAVFFNVLMMIVMLHITLKVTKSIAGEVGSYGSSVLGKVGGFAVGAASGGAGLLARGSIGKMAMKARESNWVKNNENTFLGRRVYDMSNSLSKSSFDLRSSSVVAKGAGVVGLGGALQTMGKGRTAGYEEAMEARKKEIEARGERIKTRYERDVYKKDAKGNVVLDANGNPEIQHRKGDINEEAVKAKAQYAQSNGGTVFGVSSKLKEKLDDKFVDETSAEQLAQFKEKSNKKGADGKSERDKFVSELTNRLDELKKTDTEFEGAETKTLIRTLDTINKDKKKEEEAFNTQVEDIFYKYNQKAATEKGKFLTDQSKEIQEEIKKRINSPQAMSTANASQSTILDANGQPIKNVTTDASNLGQSSSPKVADTNWAAMELPISMRDKATAPTTTSGVAADRTNAWKQGAEAVQKEMARNSPPSSHNPITDDLASSFAEEDAANAANTVINNARYGQPPPAQTTTTKPVAPTPPTSGAANSSKPKDVETYRDAYADAEERGSASDMAAVLRDAAKRGISEDEIKPSFTDL